MYYVEHSMWVHVTRGHMAKATELWLQSIEDTVRRAS
jgi:hypothetical protein